MDREESRPRGAILQRDKETYAIVLRTPVGLVTPEILERVAQVARGHSVPLVKITSGQRLALIGLRPTEIDQIWAELGLEVGPAVELCVHYVQACPGKTWCKYGKGDSLGLGRRIEESFVGVDTPAKVKIGVSGCALCCAESWMRDIGLFARSSGWSVVFGGTAAASPRIGDLIARDLGEDEALTLARACLELYVAKAKRKERTARFVKRIGIEAVKEALLGKAD